MDKLYDYEPVASIITVPYRWTWDKETLDDLHTHEENLTVYELCQYKNKKIFCRSRWMHTLWNGKVTVHYSLVPLEDWHDMYKKAVKRQSKDEYRHYKVLIPPSKLVREQLQVQALVDHL